ncbi:MAG: HD domain-containing phosphohydrolase [Armatimonadota bacterium]
MASSKRSFHLFYRGSIVTAVAIAVVMLWVIPPEAGVWKGALAFAILAIWSELTPITVPHGLGEVTISVPMHWAAMVLFGPVLAMLVAAIPLPVVNITGWVCARWLKNHESDTGTTRLHSIIRTLAGAWEGRANYPFFWALEIIIANTALDVINVGLAALAYRCVGGHVLDQRYFMSASNSMLFLHAALPFLVGIITYFIVDEARCAAAALVNEPQSPKKGSDWYSFVLRLKILLLGSVRLTWSQYLLLPPVTVLLIYLYLHVGILSGLVALGPFLSLRLAVQRAVEREKMYMDTIATLGTYMQHYHPYTRGHLKRVAELSERLARELRLSTETIMLMPYAGLLHDIGKVGVSEEILDKVGKLTDEEWSKIKEHPVKGAEIVEHIDFLNQTVDWIKYHHKWANGAGYPDDGVKNGGVPLEAAIIAVADAFDAMTDDREMSVDWECDACGFKAENGERPEVCPVCGAPKRRVYREPLSVDDAINELRRGAGSQFSPDVVHAFLKMVDREGIRVGGNG